MTTTVSEEYVRTGLVIRPGLPKATDKAELVLESGAKMYYSSRNNRTVYADSMEQAQTIARCHPVSRCLGWYD